MCTAKVGVFAHVCNLGWPLKPIRMLGWQQIKDRDVAS